MQRIWCKEGSSSNIIICFSLIPYASLSLNIPAQCHMYAWKCAANVADTNRSKAKGIRDHNRYNAVKGQAYHMSRLNEHLKSNAHYATKFIMILLPLYKSLQAYWVYYFKLPQFHRQRGTTKGCFLYDQWCNWCRQRCRLVNLNDQKPQTAICVLSWEGIATSGYTNKKKMQCKDADQGSSASEINHCKYFHKQEQWAQATPTYESLPLIVPLIVALSTLPHHKH